MTALFSRVPSAPANGLQGHRPKASSPKNCAPRRTLGLSDSQKAASDTRCPELRSLFNDAAFDQHFQPNSTVLLHGDPADAIYLIVSGTVRCCTIDQNGNRQIFSFPTKGEFVGISDIDQWHFTAEAVDHVILKSIPRSMLEQELAVNVPLRQEIRAHMRGLLAQRERQLLMLSTAKGPERLLHFLQDRAAARPQGGYVMLPMCRRDIGDHIGLSMESVSRAFSHLKREGLIDLKTCEKYRIGVQSDGIPSPVACPLLS